MQHPAKKIRWRDVTSSNIEAVGWDDAGNLYVRFTSHSLYLYRGVTRQRVVAMAHARSVGQYLNKVIKPQFEAVKIS